MSVADDRYRAMGMVLGIAPQESVQCVVHEGNPASKSRARVVNGHAFTPARTVAAQASLAQRLEGIRFEGNVTVACVFHRASRQRIDVDNLLKLVLDAGTQAKVWTDDCQVTALLGVIELDPEHPRTVVAFGEHLSSMPRGDNARIPCRVCGKMFLASTENRAHCSAACRMTLAEPVPCASCGVPFKRKNARSKYCSNPCRSMGKRTDRPCAECGKQRARGDSTLCRECWVKPKQPPLPLSV